MAKRKPDKGITPYSISQQQSALMKGNVQRIKKRPSMVKATTPATSQKTPQNISFASQYTSQYNNLIWSQIYGVTPSMPDPKFAKGDIVIGNDENHNGQGFRKGVQATVLTPTPNSDGDITVLSAATNTEVTLPQDCFDLLYKAGTAPKPKKVDFDSVYLPDDKKSSILDAIRQLDHHKLIFDEWGFGDKFEKGTAISMLFYGPPGTGKTMIGQAIADKYNKRLKVVSTAEVESSEPGQAERNIKTFFEESGDDTLLLFDECDSLIHDRAKVGMILGAQINALLMALEHYKGIVIFTTNRLSSLDPAFERRLSLKVEFEMPDAKLRKQIWQSMFPKKAPLAKAINWDKIAAVEIAGGNIKNVVLRTARMAANSKERLITQEIIVSALEAELKSMYAFKEALETNQLPGLVGGDYRKVIA